MHDASRPVRVVALVEACTVNGAVKPLLTFAEELRRSDDGFGTMDLRLFAFRRHPDIAENALTRAAADVGVPVTPILERRAFDTSILRDISTQFEKLQPHLVLSLATKSHFLIRLLGLHHACPWMAFHHGYTRIDVKNCICNSSGGCYVGSSDATG